MEEFIVLAGDGPAAADKGREFSELHQTQGRLQVRQLVVVPQAPVLLLVIITQIFYFVQQLQIIRRDHPPLAGADHLRGIEGKNGQHAEAPGRRPLDSGFPEIGRNPR